MSYINIILTALIALFVNVFFAAAKYMFKGYARILLLILATGAVAALLYLYGTGGLILW
jgi:hypothetical protein